MQRMSSELVRNFVNGLQPWSSYSLWRFINWILS